MAAKPSDLGSDAMLETHGLAHVSLAVRDPQKVERAGGKLLRQGEFAPGFPFAYVADPDGYEIELWFE
jgi:catechol 2,3-dioxygenase-like lactoylglutathione lyase family enzyme